MGPIMAAKQQDETLEIDNWEEIEETDVLEKKFNKLIMPSLEENSVNGNVDKGPIKVTLTGDDAYRSQYVPNEPLVKILKRPVKDAQNTSDSRKTIPKKTLQQREQEYAEARLRILGEASSEKPQEKISIAKPKSSESDYIIREPRGPDGTKGFNAIKQKLQIKRSTGTGEDSSAPQEEDKAKMLLGNRHHKMKNVGEKAPENKSIRKGVSEVFKLGK